MKKCVFLDRDGNINKEKGAFCEKERYEFEEGAKEAIKIFNDLGYMVVVVTNQSSVGRGFYTKKEIDNLHNYLIEEVRKSGGRIDAIYYCPHNPEVSNCNCRKPKPRMFLEAKERFNINFKASIMVGDKRSDIDAGRNLGMRTILVRTGYGAQEERKCPEEIEVYDSLYHFAIKLKNECIKSVSQICLSKTVQSQRNGRSPSYTIDITK